MNFLVIGGGIIGTAIALELAKRSAGEVTVLEKEPALGRHASGRNSGVIHSGINQKPGSLKARMCLKGSRLLRDYARKKRIPMNECGTLVAARNPKETENLERLLELGNECGVSGLTILTEPELKAREPEVSARAALFSPAGAVVDSSALLESLAEDAKALGVQYRLNHAVTAIDPENNSVETSQGRFEASHIVNCAGLETDRIAHWMGAARSLRIIPFRGEYREVKNCGVRSMVYPPPDLRFPFLGVHLTRQTDGRVLAGPSAVLAFGRESYDKQWNWREMAEMFLSRQFRKLVVSPTFVSLAVRNARLSFSKRAFLKEVQSLVPSVTGGQLLPYRSGIRAQLVDEAGRLVDDTRVEFLERSTHVLNAVSPGMTSSLAFAEWAVDRIFSFDTK